MQYNIIAARDHCRRRVRSEFLAILRIGRGLWKKITKNTQERRESVICSLNSKAETGIRGGRSPGRRGRRGTSRAYRKPDAGGRAARNQLIGLELIQMWAREQKDERKLRWKRFGERKVYHCRDQRLADRALRDRYLIPPRADCQPMHRIPHFSFFFNLFLIFFICWLKFPYERER